MRRLFISDLHPERGFNRDLYHYVKGKRRAGYITYFIGDSRMVPDSYRRLADVSIMGNHEMEARRIHESLLTHLVLDTYTLLIHGHNAEWQAQSPQVYIQDIRDLFLNTFLWLFIKKKYVLGDVHHITHSQVYSLGPPDPDEYGRLENLDLWVRDRFPEVSQVIMGHHHHQYRWVSDRGVTYHNCGAGFQGDHITLEDNQHLYFHRFK